ncbi:transcriptional regulator [Geodermatophilus sp. TF02-6]|nr:transcriptional regulator [Geodermatophilus sp. TF02-6]
MTNHGHVLLTVARDPDVRVNDVADRVGITPRAALLILRDLEDAGYLRRERVGRRTHYTIEAHRPFRHPTTASHEVDDLLAIFTDGERAAGGAPRTAAAQPDSSPLTDVDGAAVSARTW